MAGVPAECTFCGNAIEDEDDYAGVVIDGQGVWMGTTARGAAPKVLQEMGYHARCLGHAGVSTSFERFERSGNDGTRYGARRAATDAAPGASES